MTEKVKIVFADSFFDSFEGTQEDLDAIVKELTEMYEAGTLEEHSSSIEVPDDILDEVHAMLDNLKFDDYNKKLN